MRNFSAWAAAHRDAAHMLHTAAKNDIGITLRDFHESHLQGCHGRAALLVDLFAGGTFVKVGQQVRSPAAEGEIFTNRLGAPHHEIIHILGL